ncbi:MAG: CBS domain-containing protein [Patescibacteria group bacterium]
MPTMLFLSQFLDAQVVDSADKTVGKILDFIATTSEKKYPEITAFVMRDRHTKEEKIIPFSYIANLGKDEVTLDRLEGKIQSREISPQDFFLYRDILDKQIVDVEGTRVVRVNDLQIGMISGKPHVLSIDISNRGILRRIGLDRLRIFSFVKPRFIDWEKVQMIGSSLKLSTLSSELVKLHPADLANIIEDLAPQQSGHLIKSLDSETAAKVFEELEPQFRYAIMKSIDQRSTTEILSHMPVDELVDYFKSIPKRESRKLMGNFDEEKKKAVQKLVQYEDDTAGGLLTSEILRGNPNWTIADARDYIKEISDSFRTINFMYIVNDKDGVSGGGKLAGVISLRSIIVANPSEKISKVMKRIKKSQTINVNAEIEEIAEMMTKYNLSSVAVLDDEEKFIGVVTIDDVMRQFVPDA